MKDRIRTNNLRNIKKSFLRFLSLLVMGALGVFAFTGLIATAPDMIKSLDKYLDDSSAYDIRIISDLGLDPEDIDAVKALPEIEDAEGSYFRDTMCDLGIDERVVTVISLPERLNTLELTSGHLPEKKSEVAVEENLLEVNGLKVGDMLTLEDDGFYEVNVTICGTVRSPLYYNAVGIDPVRGSTNIGTGVVSYYIYAPVTNFKQDYLSGIYATVAGAKSLTSSYDDYNELVATAMKSIENIVAEREQSRYDTIMKMADDEIDSMAADANAQLDAADEKLRAAKEELESAARQLVEGEAQLNTLKEELEAARKKIDEADTEIAGKENELNEAKKTLESAGREIGEKEAQINEAGALLDEALATLREKESELEAARAQIAAGKTLLDSMQAQADAAKKQIEDGEAQLKSGEEQLAAGRKAYDDGKRQLEAQAPALEEGRKKIEEGQSEIDKAKEDLDTAKSALEYLRSEQENLYKSDNITEDIINSERERLSAAIEEVRYIFERLVEQYRAGTLTRESARLTVRDALSAYTRNPTVLERLIFYRIAIEYLEPLVSEGEAQYAEALDTFTKGKQQYEEGKKTYDEANAALSAALKELGEGEERLANARKELEAGKEEYSAGLKELQNGYAEYESGLAALSEGEALLSEGFAEYEEKLSQYEEGRALLEDAKLEYFDGIRQLSEGEEALEDAKRQLEEGKKEYESGAAGIAQGESELAAAKEEYESGLSQYNAGLAEYESGRANLDEEIRKARLKLGEINLPTWYVYDRTGYQTYSDYIDDASSIRNLSRVFPIVFFMVAVLVSLISMSRMVELDRLEIGTLKSLGYTREKVMTKYSLFSILATAIGGLIGSVLGLIILPTLIFNIYGILFDIPKLYLGPNWASTLTGFAIVMIFVCGAGMLKAVAVMREKPADLLRPKAPKPGKRILLERIPFIWRKVRFSDKITIRNLFRYKRRLFVTVFGITGCTALMLSGFGLKDAIVDLPTVQFGKVFDYDALTYITGMDNSGRDERKIARILDQDEIEGYTESMRISAETGGFGCNIFTLERSESFSEIVNLKSMVTGETIVPETGKVVITKKLSKLTGLGAGDTIEITDINHVAYEYEISDVADNYFEHYVFMDKDTLEKYTEYKPNMIYLHTEEMSAAEQDALSERLLENPAVLNVTFKDKLIENADNMLKSLDKVVLILIILSALLSFVVLYNLSNININERRREIATLKVLGFYDPEVDGYINKENVIVTVIGIIAGLLIGILLTKIVVGTVEIEKASFINVIKWQSYLFAAGMSALFTFIVNRITHFNLKKINMIDSLKSVE